MSVVILRFFILCFVGISSSLVAQGLDISPIIKSVYCPDISCFDSIMVNNGYKKTPPRKETDGTYTVYTEPNWGDRHAPTVFNYVLTKKGEIIITIHSYHHDLNETMVKDLPLPSIKFTAASLEKYTDKYGEISGGLYTYKSEKHPDILVSNKLNFTEFGIKYLFSIYYKPPAPSGVPSK